MRRCADADFEAWVARTWDVRPRFSHDFLREMHEEAKQHKAAQRVETAQARQIAGLTKRIATLEQQLGRLPAVLRSITRVKAAAPDVEALADIARRLDAVEARPDGMRYLGLWNAATDYQPGAVTTKAGAAWVACELTMAGEQPGKSDRWRMIAKSDTAELRKLVREELKREPTCR